jgi:hypothetical protein
MAQLPPHIGTLNEKSLHAALKEWYARPGDRLEVSIDGYVIDIVRGDLLIEIQTRSFGAMKRKLEKLTRHHRVRLVYPIAREKWIVKQDSKGNEAGSRRKSPKRGSVEQIFDELVSIPKLLAEESLSLEILLIQEEEVRRFGGGRRKWWRRKWRTHERLLLQVLESRRFNTPADLAQLLPASLPDPFSTADLAEALGIPRAVAQRMAYCLREMGTIAAVDKRGNAILYSQS